MSRDFSEDQKTCQLVRRRRRNHLKMFLVALILLAYKFNMLETVGVRI